MAVGIRHADHVEPFIRNSWQSLRRQAAVARSVWFASGLRPWSLFLLVWYCFSVRDAAYLYYNFFMRQVMDMREFFTVQCALYYFKQFIKYVTNA
jgi:hypothetical protein